MKASSPIRFFLKMITIENLFYIIEMGAKNNQPLTSDFNEFIKTVLLQFGHLNFFPKYLSSKSLVLP